MKKRHYSENSCCEDDDEEDSWPERDVRESDRDQLKAGFRCSHCGKKIGPGEEYYCHVFSREEYEYEDGEVVVTPLKARQVSTWCEDCYERTLTL